jgi:hypothetical protein
MVWHQWNNFMEMQDSLMEENENIIAKFGLLELEESSNRL